MINKKQPLTSNPTFHPVSLLRTFWKQRYLAVSLWILIGLAGTAVILRLPFVYKAETLILVDSQRIPERYVVSTVVSDLEERLSTLTQQILSTSRLQTIIESYNLYPDERRKYVPEEVIAMMRKDITVNVERSASSRPGAFRVSYEGRDPVVVAKVANRLASLYMDENLMVRENEAEQTNEFLDRELQEAKARLDEMERRLSRYKLDHMGALPEQEASLSNRVTGLQVALQANEDAQNRAQQQILMLQSSLDSSVDQESDPETDPVGTIAAVDPESPAVTKAKQLRAELAQLRLRYTDSHPDVIKVQNELIVAEQNEKAEQQSLKASKTNPPAHLSQSSQRKPKRNLEMEAAKARLKSQIAQLTNEYESLKRERAKLLEEAGSYQARIELLPVREQEMTGLTRDYETSKLNYSQLLDKRFDARMAGHMEKLKKAERFTVLDEAKPPQKPIRPKRPLLFGCTWALGLALALGVGFARESMNSVVLGEWEIPGDVRILGRVSRIPTAFDSRASKPASKIAS
jgi:succinoglycan biosynthesis transport protein ExoP